MKNLTTIILVLITFYISGQTNIEKHMINEINGLRANPKSFIPNIESYIKTQEYILTRINSGNVKVKSTSGTLNSKNKISNHKNSSGTSVIRKRISSAKELISELEVLESLDTLIFNIDMYVLTKKQGKYLDSTNQIGHFDSNGNGSSNRFKALKLNVSDNVCSSGNITSNKAIERMLVNLLVDYGIASRGHRKNLLSKDIKLISIYISDNVCIQNFSK